MAKRSQSKKQKSLLNQVCNPDAAGIDVGAEEIVVAVPEDRAAEAVRSFGTCNADLREAVQWVTECSITTVAMESTGNYWVTLYQFLQEAGIEVYVVNARHLKAVPGRKSDVHDARWTQQLHTAGLLKKSFVPEPEVLAMRYLHRQRQELIQGGCQAIQHMQKVLTEMNVQLHHVLSDIDGMSGRRIIEAIIAGNRDPHYLETLRDPRCKTPKDQVIKALDGNFRAEYIVTLKLAYERWQQLQLQIGSLEEELSRLMASYRKHQSEADELAGQDEECAESKGRHYELKAPPASEGAQSKALAALPLSGKTSSRKHEFCFDLRSEALSLYGTDLSLIPSISTGALSTLICEVGAAEAFRKSFRSCAQFTSWMGLCPDNRISGGKQLGKAKTRRIKNRLAGQLRLCAMTLYRNDSALGHYCRRMKAKLGKAEGITATAHKLARIIYALISTGRSYEEAQVTKVPEAALKRRLRSLEKQAKTLGFQLVAQ